VGQPAPSRGGAGLRQRLDGVDGQPAGGDRGRGAPRRPDDRDGEPFLPDERVDLPTALAAFTTGSAYALRLEAETGSVTPGKLADLAVLDRDPFDRAAGPIGRARVLATLVEGEPVWAEESLDPG
jgi:predicted amidohydrolase YtcJ